jgi:hypothetical protein
MTIQDFIDVCKDIALNKLGLKSFYLGNTWDMSVGKGDIYPNCWLETPFLLDYSSVKTNSKQLSFSIDILDLAKSDNVDDEYLVISKCEEYSDLFLSYLKQNTDFSLIDHPTGLTVRHINADNSVGIRLDIKVNIGRLCLPK